MKRFFINLGIYFILFFITSNLVALLITNIPVLSKTLDFGPEVYIAITNSNKKTNDSTIILGDSVAHQIFKSFDSIKDNFYDLTTNQAVSMAGQYILIMNIINNNKNIKEIYLVYHPRSFSNNLYQIWTFDYFVKPFLTIKNKKYFSQLVLEKLNKLKIYKIAIMPIIKIIPNFPSLDYSKFSEDSNKNLSFLSDISIEYLKKIKIECQKNNINFKVISCPIKKSSIDNYDLLKKQIHENNLEDIFQDFFKKMQFYDDSNFMDPFHFKKDYIIKNRENIINSLLN